MKHKNKIIIITLFSVAILPLFVILNSPQNFRIEGQPGIIKVEWSNDRGGKGDCKVWYDIEKTWKWDCGQVPIVQPGRNTITVTAINAEGKKGIDVLVVNP